MPNFDAGHYFLTVAAPIRMDSLLVEGQSRSRRHLIREALAAIPTADQTAAYKDRRHFDDPFSRTTRTHFARFVVIDDVIYNGRVSGDALLGLAEGIDPVVARPVDRLTSPFLVFAADFDARSGDDGELCDYCRQLWEAMRPELVSVLQHCVGFQGVASAEAFFAYIKKCQLETTMPFNDYWSTPLDATDFQYRPYLGVLGVLSLAAGYVGFKSGQGAWFEVGPGHGLLVGFGIAIAGIVLAAAVLVVIAYLSVMRRGQQAFPTSPAPAPGSDLPTVLKALYVQRGFTELAIRTQGMDDEQLYREVGEFLAACRPGDVRAPTQKPGVIGV